MGDAERASPVFLPKQAEKSTIHMSMFLEEERFMKTERENKKLFEDSV